MYEVLLSFLFVPHMQMQKHKLFSYIMITGDYRMKLSVTINNELQIFVTENRDEKEKYYLHLY